MRTKIVVWVWFAAIASGSAAPQVDREKLRQAAGLPQMSLHFGLVFSSTRGLIAMWDMPDMPAEIAALQKEMKGDASDAERYYRLGQLYREMKEKDRAKEAFARAVDLFRQQMQAQPGDGRLLAQFGKALSAAGNKEEAETVLRQAVQAAPQEWRGWTALGQFLQDRSLSVLLGPDVTVEDMADYQKLFAQISQNKPPPEQVAQSQKLLEEARDCYDRTVAVAPQEPQPYAERGKFRVYSQVYIQGLISVIHGEEATPQAAMFSPEVLSDFQQAARLSPNDPGAIATAALFEIMAFAVQSGQQPDLGKGEGWDLPEQSKQSVQEALSQLEKLAQSQEAHVAAGALEALGMLQTFVGDRASAEANLRRAITLDPSREQVWEALIVLMASAERYGDLASVCEERLKHKDSARTHLLLAKAYERLNRIDRAEEQVQAALKLAPGDFTADLALAVLLLKRNDEAALSQAGELLTQMGDGLLFIAGMGESPSRQQWMDYTLIRGIYRALTGELAEARQDIDLVLRLDPNNEAAKEALEALGE